MEDSFGALCVQPQKANDIRYLYNGEEIVLFDIPRTNDYGFNYNGVIEEIKNGRVKSAKYKGKKIRVFNPVFVGEGNFPVSPNSIELYLLIQDMVKR